MISATHLHLRRGHKVILDDLRFVIAPGRITVLLGENGAGKSSLLRLLAGEWTPSRGELRLDGRTFSSIPPLQMARVRAVVPQSVDWRFAFTVREMVSMGRHPHGDADLPAGRDIVNLTLERMALGALADRPVTRLSGGEQRRVLLARALAQSADARREGRGVLLLDEPAANLDLRHQHLLLSELRACARDGLAVVAVLHDLNQVAELADDILLLREGRLLGQGPAPDILREELLSLAYGIPLRRLPQSAGPDLWTTRAAGDSFLFTNPHHQEPLHEHCIHRTA